MSESNKITRCRDCNSIVYEDGTAANCAGECERELNLAEDYKPLNFDNDEVLRDLPSVEEIMWLNNNEVDYADYEFEGLEDTERDPTDI